MHFSWGQKKMAQQVKAPVAKPDDLSLILGYLLWKERTIPQVVFWPPGTCAVMNVSTHLHSEQTNKQKQNKNISGVIAVFSYSLCFCWHFSVAPPPSSPALHCWSSSHPLAPFYLYVARIQSLLLCSPHQSFSAGHRLELLRKGKPQLRNCWHVCEAFSLLKKKSMYILFACVSVHYMFAMPMETRRGQQIPRDWNYKQSRASMSRNWTQVLRKRGQCS